MRWWALVLLGGCAPAMTEELPTFAAPPVTPADAGVQVCFGTTNDGLPERVHFRDATASFNRRWYVALKDGRLWVKPNDEQGAAPGPWQLLGTGLPAGSGLVRFSAPTSLTELSADGVHLQVKSSDGVLYRGTDFTSGSILRSFEWTDKWGWPAGEGSGLRDEPGERVIWSVSDSHPFGVDHFEDRNGTTHKVGLGVAHQYRLGADGRSLFFNDWWLPNDWSRQLCPPARGTLGLLNLSVSASTLFVVGERGALFTLLYDFDIGGENDLLEYSYVLTRASGTTRALPAGPWQRQPDITDGLITSRITIFQDGQGNAARVLRVEGVREGVTGYFHKRIDAPTWSFTPTGHRVCGPFLNERPALQPPVMPPDDHELTGTLRLGAQSLTVRVVDFNVVCSPARVQVLLDGKVVTAGGAPLELPLHHVHGLVTARRPTGYWRAGMAATIRGALLPPRLDGVDDPAARRALERLFGRRRVVNLTGTATDSTLQLKEIDWLTPFLVPGDEKAFGERVTLSAP